MKEIWKTIQDAFYMTILIISLIGTLAIGIIIGKALMHEQLTEDMKRNQEAGIPCRNPDGKFYIYTYDMTYIEWEQKRN